MMARTAVMGVLVAYATKKAAAADSTHVAALKVTGAVQDVVIHTQDMSAVL